jgi:tRNA pseudouridine13 synthase
MKIKVRPEDFRVEELLQLRFARHGRYSIYRLEKRDATTLGVLERIGRKYRLGRLSRAGLKDRQSLSVQYISAEGRGPGRISEPGFSLKHIGFSSRPVTREILLGNRFTIVIRDLSREEVETAQRNFPLLRDDGFPNYYDEQRFGSVRPGRGFIAEKLIRGDLDGAMRLYAATQSKLKAKVKAYHPKRAPVDPATAISRIQRDLLELFVTSYQSYLWNETLAELIRSLGLPSRAVPYIIGELLFFTSLDSTARRFFEQHEIPVASPAAILRPERIAQAVSAVMKRQGIGLKDMKLAVRIPGLWFKPYTRPGVVAPRELRLSGPEPDDLHPGKEQLELAFDLPPGSYATMVVRRLMVPFRGASSPPQACR